MNNQAILQDLKQRLVAAFGPEITRVLVYGSVARGDDRKDSGIDVMLVFRDLPDRWERWHRAADIAADVSFDHDTLISLRVTSEQELATAYTPLFMNVRKEGLAL